MTGTPLTVGKPLVAVLCTVAVPEMALALRRMVSLQKEEVPDRTEAHRRVLALR